MDTLNLFGFIENLALYFPKTKTIAMSFLSLSLSAVDRGELFCSCKQTFYRPSDRVRGCGTAQFRTIRENLQNTAQYGLIYSKF